MRMRTKCSIEGCTRQSKARTWCGVHYGRWHKYGDPNIQLDRECGPMGERFWRKVQKGPGCWEWTASTHGGYGIFHDGSNPRGAHRISYELTVGPIPEGMLLDHRCRNTLCVNPDHLRPVTRKQNGEHRGGASRSSTTGVLGVTWHKDTGMYMARVGHNGRLVHAGRFKTLEEAAEAARQLRLSLFTHNDLDRKAS